MSFIPSGSRPGTAARRPPHPAASEPELPGGRPRVHINAHAASTPMGDLAEARALTKALGPAARQAAVSATKSMTGHVLGASTGHVLGASGALEAALAVLARHHRTAPPTLNTHRLGEGIDLNLVTGPARPLPDGNLVALSTSFGFGGHNVALVFHNRAHDPGAPPRQTYGHRHAHARASAETATERTN
ncbi:hypothetical protein P8605_06800 [Streptomyces sp. T-3]|nr:hypothetical protein [Streptomyces sp. T-3]